MRIVSVILIVLGGAACGGGAEGTVSDFGGTGPAAVRRTAALQVTFPPGGSTTDAAATMVCGRVTGGPVDAVLVNGHPARSDDGYQTWVCELPLEPGFNDIAIECVESNGNRLVETGPRVHRGDTKLSAPTDAAAYSGGIAVLDLKADSILAYDLESGAGHIVSGPDVGSGIGFVNPVFMALCPDASHAVVFDIEDCRVVSVDMATGARTLLSDVNAPGGDLVVRVPIATDGAYAYLPVARAMFGVDLRTGAREVLWRAQLPDYSAGSSGIASLSGFALERTTGRFVVVDGLGDQLWTVTPTGVHELVSPSSSRAPIGTSGLIALTSRRTALVEGAGHTLVEIDLRHGARRTISLERSVLEGATSFAWIGDRLIVTESWRGLVHRIDPASGTVETVLSATAGTGVDVRALAPAIAADGAGTVVVDTASATIVEFDYDSGRRDAVADGLVDFPVSDARSIDLVAGTREAIVLDRVAGIVRVDLDGGTANVVSADLVQQPAAVRVDEVNYRGIVLDTFASTGSIVAVDLDTGKREVVAPAPPGPRVFEFGANGGLALHPDGDTAYVARPDAVLERIDLITGARTSVHIVGPQLSAPTDAVYDSAGRCVLVLDRGRGAILAVDPASGESRTVSGPGRGLGPALLAPESIALDPTRNVAHVVDGNRTLAIELETGARVLTIR